MSNCNVYTTTISCSVRSGIGFALAQRLLSEKESDVRVCLACRNMEKATVAQQLLLADHPDCKVDILHVDVSSVASVKTACAEIQRRYGLIT